MDGKKLKIRVKNNRQMRVLIQSKCTNIFEVIK